MTLANKPDTQLSPSQRNIFGRMVELLGRAGLEYSGGFVNAGDHRIHYLDYGTGAPVVLVHGGGAGGATWYRQIAELSKHFRVIAPDNPVFGLSSQPGFPVPMPDITTGFLTSLMDGLGIESASFVGISLGGFAAARTASKYPERVDRLVIINSAGLGRDLPWGFRLIAMPALGWFLSRPHRWTHERFFERSEVVNPNVPDAGAYLEYAFSVTANEGHSTSLRRNMPVFANLRGQRNILTDQELASIESDTLIIWGDQDRFFPVAHGERAESLIPRSRFVKLQECGHVAMLDQPERLNEELVRFLTSEPISNR